MLEKLLTERLHGSLDIGSKNVRGLKLGKGRIEGMSKKTLVGIYSREEKIEKALESAVGEVVDELGLRGKNVAISLSGQRFYSKTISIPKEEDADRRLDNIHEELESIIPNYDPLDFLTEEILLRSDEDEEEVLTISIERERIEEILEIMTRLKVKVLRIVPDYVACYNLVEQKILLDTDDRYGGVTGVIDVGFEGTKVYFIDKNGIKMFINTLIGGRDFTEIIKEHKGTTYEEAEVTKKEIELGEQRDHEDVEMGMFTELTNTFNELEENIAVSLDFFTKKSITSNIQRLILVGEGSLLKGFKDYLQGRVELKTEYMEYEDLGLDELDLKLGNLHQAEVANLLGNISEEVI